MTMLNDTRAALARTFPAPARREAAGAGSAAAHWAMIKRVCVGALAILGTTAALAAVMALKIAIYLPPVLHH